MSAYDFNMANLSFGAFNYAINPRTYEKVEAYNLHEHHHVIVTRCKRQLDQAVALRLRIGRVGFDQWLNELQVYLLPNFDHKNIVPFLGCDKRYAKMDEENMFTSFNALEDNEKDSDSYRSEPESGDSDNDQEFHGSGPGVQWRPVIHQGESRKSELKTRETPMEYWIVNDFSYSATLRHYIVRQALSWPQMIVIARGIAAGLHYLHEHHSYQRLNLGNDAATEAFRRESDGHMKFFSYTTSRRGTVRIEPPNLMTIVHRSLTSLSVVLRGDLTPCIWDFGTAHVYHPYQPLNYLTTMDSPNQYLIMNSVYTPPEVLRTSSVFTSRALKAVDMYALGFIFWEMLSRCRLPPIDEGMPYDNAIRENPGSYKKPLSSELKTEEPSCNLLYQNVCAKRVRPSLRPSWLRGKKSNRFIRTIKELWDEDFESRIQVSTVIERLAVMSLRNRDTRVNIPDYVDKTLEPPITQDQMTPSELEATPTVGHPPHAALPRILDTSAPREDVRCMRSDLGYLDQRQSRLRQQQRINVRRQIQLRRDLHRRHPPRPTTRQRSQEGSQTQATPERRSKRLAARSQQEPAAPSPQQEPAAPSPARRSQPATSTSAQRSQPAASTSAQRSQPATSTNARRSQTAASTNARPSQTAASTNARPSQTAASTNARPSQTVASTLAQRLQPVASTSAGAAYLLLQESSDAAESSSD